MANLAVWLKQRNKVWHLYWRENGTIKSRSCHTTVKAETDELLEAKRRELRCLSLGLGQAGILYDEAVKLFLAEPGKEASSIRIDTDSLTKFKESQRPSKVELIRRDHIMAWYTEMLVKPYKPATIHIHLRNLKKFLKYCIQRRWISESCFAGIKMPRDEEVARFLTPEECTKLFEGCRFNPELERIVRFTLLQGVRKGELLNLSWDRINIVEKTAKITKTKTKKDRIVPLHPTAVGLLGQPKTEGRVFDGWDVDRLNRAFRRAVARAKIGKCRFHDLRHTCLSNLDRTGASLAQIKVISGHRSIASLNRYMHSHIEDARESLNKLQ